MAEAAALAITVVLSPTPREVREWVGVVPAGSCVGDAIKASALDIPSESVAIGVWGRKCDALQMLRDGDRVEIYRALTVDPKVARRERFRKQGVKTPGLFASRRTGAKPGY